ncbi:MAG: EAL domain-containing protein [Gammaproteobacteria bacterium]
MTLAKQLILSGLIVLFCLFMGMMSFMLRNTQEFLNQQLASHAQDTATALGLTITNYVEQKDMVNAERAVAAVFDRGYYEKILVQSLDGIALISKEQKVLVKGVPNWFIGLLPLVTPTEQAYVMNEWQRFGTITVQSNPGFAYEQIWTTFKQSFIWLILISGGAVLFGTTLLYFILKPLRAITLQAIQICNQQFSILEPLPWTIDLRKVVVAMNTMSRRLQQIFEDQAKASEALREQAFKDTVTGLGNRRYFDSQFQYLLKSEQPIGGILILIELKAFKVYNDKHGYEAGDRLLKKTGEVLLSATEGNDNAIIAHMGGASFSAILPNKTKEIGEEIAGKICSKFNDFVMQGFADQPDVGHVGIAVFSPDLEQTDILAQADMALRNAQGKSGNAWHCYDKLAPEQIHGARKWNEIFQMVIQKRSIVLYFQKQQLFQSNDSLYYETLMRIKSEDGTLMHAGLFMPMAERLNRMTDLDKLVIEQLVARILGDKDRNLIYTANISPTSFDEENFVKWLYDKVKSLGKKASHLVIELPEYGVISRIEKIRPIYIKLSSLGVLTSIDHFGRNFSSFAYLHNLKLNFLRIDGSFIKDIHQNTDNQFFIKSLIKIAQSLDIIVFAEAVETDQELESLTALGVDGVQGYLVGKPQEISS